jgi:hypothetical protein
MRKGFVRGVEMMVRAPIVLVAFAFMRVAFRDEDGIY